MTVYYGHTNPNDPPHDKSRWQLMKDHALNVADRARRNAEAFGEGPRAELAGQLHDLGKYGELFQRRLLGLERGLDHWSVGACFVKQAYKDAALTLVIQGHHIGLQKGDGETLKELTLEALVREHPLGLRLTEPPPNQSSVAPLRSRLLTDGVALPRPVKTDLRPGATASEMLDTRILFSALVDADYLDTEDAMRLDGTPPRPTNDGLDAARALSALEATLTGLGANTDVPEETRQLRADLMQACRAAGLAEDRLWTLTAPTGSGKTLAMLLFALVRARKAQAFGQLTSCSLGDGGRKCILESENLIDFQSKRSETHVRGEREPNGSR